MTENQKTFASAAIGMATGAVTAMGVDPLLAGIGALGVVLLADLHEGDDALKNFVVYFGSCLFALSAFGIYFHEDVDDAPASLLGNDVTEMIEELPIQKSTIDFQLS